MTRRTLRLAALAAVAALVLPLAACETNQGTAAYVGKTRITTDQLDEQVDKFYANAVLAKAGEGRRPKVRTTMVYGMVMAELFKQLAVENDAALTDEQLKTIVAEIEKNPAQMSQLFNGTLADLTPEIFAKLLGYLQSLQTHVGKTEGSEEAANAKFNDLLATAGERHPVKLNPRYGTFDPKSLAINLGGEDGIRDLPASPTPGAEQPQQGEQPPGEPQQGEQPPGEPQQGEQPPGQEQPEPDAGQPEPQPSPPAN